MRIGIAQMVAIPKDNFSTKIQPSEFSLGCTSY